MLQHRSENGQIMTPSGYMCPLVRFGLPAACAWVTLRFTHITLRSPVEATGTKEMNMHSSTFTKSIGIHLAGKGIDSHL